MATLPIAAKIARAGTWSRAADRVTLDHADRVRLKKRLKGDAGLAFRVDLPEGAEVAPGDALVLDDGKHIEVRAAKEPLYVIKGDLARISWHLGRHGIPCAFGKNRLAVHRSPALKRLLQSLGANLVESEAAFLPEPTPAGTGRIAPPKRAQVAHHGYRHHLADEAPEEGDVDSAPGEGGMKP